MIDSLASPCSLEPFHLKHRNQSWWIAERSWELAALSFDVVRSQAPNQQSFTHLNEANAGRRLNL